MFWLFLKHHIYPSLFDFTPFCKTRMMSVPFCVFLFCYFFEVQCLSVPFLLFEFLDVLQKHHIYPSPFQILWFSIFFKSTTFTFPFSHFWVPRLFRKTTYLSVPFSFHFRFPTFSKKHKNYSSLFAFPVFSPIWRHITFIRPFFFVSQHFWKTAHLSVPFFISHSANFFLLRNSTFVRPSSNFLFSLHFWETPHLSVPFPIFYVLEFFFLFSQTSHLSVPFSFVFAFCPIQSLVTVPNFFFAKSNKVLFFS